MAVASHTVNILRQRTQVSAEAVTVGALQVYGAAPDHVTLDAHWPPGERTRAFLDTLERCRAEVLATQPFLDNPWAVPSTVMVDVSGELVKTAAAVYVKPEADRDQAYCVFGPYVTETEISPALVKGILLHEATHHLLDGRDGRESNSRKEDRANVLAILCHDDPMAFARDFFEWQQRINPRYMHGMIEQGQDLRDDGGHRSAYDFCTLLLDLARKEVAMREMGIPDGDRFEALTRLSEESTHPLYAMRKLLNAAEGKASAGHVAHAGQDARAGYSVAG